MKTLGTVRVFGPEDGELIRALTLELYRLVPYELRAKTNSPITFRNKIRRSIFRMLRPNAPLKTVPIDGAGVRKVLLFRYDHLGDYITTTPILEWLKAAVPGVTIDVVGSYRNRSLLESDPRIRRVVAINPSHEIRPSWMRVWKLGKEEDYDVVIALVYDRMTKAAVLTRLASRRALKVTIRHDEREAIYGQVFDVQVPWVQPEHKVLTMARVGASAINPVVPVPPHVARPRIPIDVEAVKNVRKWLSERDLYWGFRPNARTIPNMFDVEACQDARPYILVNISGSAPNRQWEPVSCVPVIQMLRAQRPELAILVSGAPKDHQDVEAIVGLLNDPHVLMWKGSVFEMVAVIAGARQLMSPDTGTIHVAAAAMVPCTALFAELIKVAEWYPFGVPFRCVLSADPATINSIPPSTIVQAAVDLLNNT